MLKCVFSVAVCHRGYLDNFIRGATPITRELVPAWLVRHPKHAPTIRVFTASWMCLVFWRSFPRCRYTFSSIAPCHITPVLATSHHSTVSRLLLSQALFFLYETVEKLLQVVFLLKLYSDSHNNASHLVQRERIRNLMI